MKSTASAVWTGSLKEGAGKLSTGSGAFNDSPYTFAKRFEGAGAGHDAGRADRGGALRLLRDGDVG